MLEVPAKATLVVSYVGYKTLEVPVNGKKTLNINLKEDTEMLDEVVVVGYGTQKKATLTGSVSQVGGEELKKVAATNLTNTLAGKTAGVIANTRSGEPGEDNADILIRGKGTLGSTSPLIVVDGIADRSFSRLNPEDIESISVLKDASAAIYGARAANGVILVTTKRGTEGKVKINYSGNVSFSQPTRIPEMLDSYQYATYVNEYDAGHGEAATYSAEALGMIQSGEDQIRYPNTDWWSEVAKDWATKTQHSLAISGGNDKISFYTSAQYMYQDAIYKKGVQDYNQYQFTTNLDAKITKAIKFSMDILGRQEVRNRGVYSTEDLFGYFLTTNPMAAPYYPNGLLRVGYDGVTNNAAVKVTDIPGTNKTTYSTLNLKPRLRVDLDVITKGLYVEGYAALDFHFNDGKQINNPYDVYQYDAATDSYINRRDATGSISVNQWFNKDKTITLNARLGYSHDFKGGHHVDAFIAYEQSKYDYTGISAYRTNYLSTTIPEIFAGSDVAKDKDNSGSSNVTARQNYFGRINYAYKDKYLTEFTMRYDGSMNFAPGHRWGYFPSFSGAWRISEEEFMESTHDWLSSLKIRASWGMLGNQDALNKSNPWENQYYPWMQTYNLDGNYPMGGNLTTGYYQKAYRIEDLSWEKSTTWGIGLDAVINHVTFTFDYYDRKTTDIIMEVPVPTEFGLDPYFDNVGSMRNRGVEVQLGYNNKWNDWSLNVMGNMAYNKNKIEDLGGVDRMTNPDDGDLWRFVGKPIDSYYVYKADGFFQSDAEAQQWMDTYKGKDGYPFGQDFQAGDLRYVDTNGDGKLDADDRVCLRLSIQLLLFGLNLNVGYKAFDLTLNFTGAANVGRAFTKEAFGEFSGSAGHPSTAWLDSWTPENTNASMPRVAESRKSPSEASNVMSDFWVINTSYLRLKTLQLGYTLPKSVLNAIGLSNVRVYYSAENLFTIDSMPLNVDPETVSSRLSSYPLVMTNSFGVNVTF